MHVLLLAATLQLSQLLAPVNAWVSAFNSGQTAFPSDAFTDDGTVIDEFAPYTWSKDRATVRQWYAYLVGADSPERRAKFLSYKEHLWIGAPHDVQQKGDAAYLVFNAVVTFLDGGKTVSQPGTFVVVERRTPQGWRISANSWAIVGNLHD
jgi:hypothetical protein